MRKVETMNGRGTVQDSDGESVQVQYELDVYQEDLPAGTPRNNPHTTVPGMKEVRGIVTPVCFFGADKLLLTMQDGRRLRFFFTDTHGSVRGSGEPSA